MIPFQPHVFLVHLFPDTKIFFLFNIFGSSPYASQIMENSFVEFKINTKEKMHVITVENAVLTANMAESFVNQAVSFLDQPVKNLIIDFSNVKTIDPVFGHKMADLQHSFYNKNVSMVFCHLSKDIQKMLEEQDLLDTMNLTPTESEAWDIVQMEEIERELF